MVNPEDLNTLLHWAVSFNNVNAAKALIDRGSGQSANISGKTPVEIAMGAYEHGDSSYFNIRTLMAQHVQSLRKK